MTGPTRWMVKQKKRRMGLSQAIYDQAIKMTHLLVKSNNNIKFFIKKKKSWHYVIVDKRFN